jgi:hypothetical protein
MPAMVWLEEMSFVSESERKLFEKPIGRSPKPFFQVLARGDLECKSNFKFQESDDGDIVAGNGFGFHGLAKCRLKSPVVLILREMDPVVSR